MPTQILVEGQTRVAERPGGIVDIDRLPTLKRIVEARKERMERKRRAAAAAVEPESSWRSVDVTKTPEQKMREECVWETRERGRRQLALWETEKLKRERKAKRKIQKQLDAVQENQSWSSMKKISLEVALKYQSLGVTYSDLFSVRRSKEVVLARHECFYRARIETNKSFPEMGRFFGGRDHTTALHGVNRYRDLQSKIAKGESIPRWIPKEFILEARLHEVAE